MAKTSDQSHPVSYTSCFVGIPLPSTYLDAFRRLSASLGELNLGIRLADPATPHVTLYYLADQTRIDLTEIAALVEQQKQILESTTIAIHGLRVFDPGSPRVLYLEVETSPQLEAAHTACRTALHRYYPAGRNLPFHAHLTLGRIPTPTAQQAFRAQSARVALLCSAIRWEFPVTELVLYGIEAGREERSHQAIQRIPINASV